MRANIKSTCIKQVLFSTIKSSGFVKYAFGARIYFISPMDFTPGDSEIFHSYHLFAVNCPSSASLSLGTFPRGGRLYWEGEFCHAKLGAREAKGEKNRRPMAASAAPKTHLYHEISVLEHILCRSHADSLLKKAAKMILIRKSALRSDRADLQNALGKELFCLV